MRADKTNKEDWVNYLTRQANIKRIEVNKFENQGVYKIENTIEHKIYIGQSNNIKNRINNHLKALGSNKHIIPKLQEDFNRLGKEVFITNTLFNSCDKKERLEKEKEYIETYIKEGWQVYNTISSETIVPTPLEYAAVLKELITLLRNGNLSIDKVKSLINDTNCQ